MASLSITRSSHRKQAPVPFQSNHVAYIFRVGKLVSSEKGTKLRSKVWHEVLEILIPVVPAVERVVYHDF